MPRPSTCRDHCACRPTGWPMKSRRIRSSSAGSPSLNRPFMPRAAGDPALDHARLPAPHLRRSPAAMAEDARAHRERHPSRTPTIRNSSSPPSMTSSTRCSTTWSSRCACWPWPRGTRPARHHHHRLVHGALHPPAGGGALNQLVYCARQIQRQEFDLTLPPTVKRAGELSGRSRPWPTSSASSTGSWRARWRRNRQAATGQRHPLLPLFHRPETARGAAQPPHPAKLLERAAAHQHIEYIRLTRFEHNAMPVYITGAQGVAWAISGGRGELLPADG